jgi:hypothetical protein
MSKERLHCVAIKELFSRWAARQGQSFRAIPQIGLLVLCLVAAGGAFHFLPVRRKFLASLEKVVVQTAVFRLRMRKGLGAILAGGGFKWAYAKNTLRSL